MKSFKEVMAPRHYADGALISAKLPPAYEKAKGDKNCANCGAYVPGTKYCKTWDCLLYTSPSPRDKRQSRMPSSA